MYANPTSHSSQAVLRYRLRHLAQRHGPSRRMYLHTPLLRIRLPRAQRTDALHPLHRVPVIALLYREPRRRGARHVDFLDIRGVFRAGEREVEVLEGAAAWAPCGHGGAAVCSRAGAREPGKERTDEALGGGRAGGHDVYCGLDDGDADADVPGAVRVCGGEAVVVDDEAADGYAGGTWVLLVIGGHGGLGCRDTYIQPRLMTITTSTLVFRSTGLS
jgi:hypothetical protein